jgi:hypothetical protein
MLQGALPFQYEIEGGPSGLTALAGLPLYLDLMAVCGLRRSFGRHVLARGGAQGWTDAEVLTSLTVLNVAGGDCVDDLRTLEADEGFCRVLQRAELAGLPRRERRAIERRWRKEKKRAVPSPSSAFRYLERFHDEDQEALRHAAGAQKAFIPASNAALRGLPLVNRDLLAFAGAQGVDETATLDTDATLIETKKKAALHCYKHFPAYQPMNVWWAEQGLMVHTEFRDGNVPAGHEQLRVFQEALSHLPKQVKKVRARSDTAGYQHDLMKYCESGADPRFGRIEFAFSSDVTPEFKKAVAAVPGKDWHPMHRVAHGRVVATGVEWAEVCFVPEMSGRSKRGLEYRYLATREAMREQELPGLECQRELPFPTMTWAGGRYKVFGVVTNMDWEGERLIHWHHERCGKSEEAHAVLKNDLAGGRMPSQRFGVNAAWWWVSMLAHNLNAIMKRRVLGPAWADKRLKAIRFSLINLPGRVLERARRLIIRLTQWQPLANFLIEMRCRIAALVPGPAG